MKFKRMAAAFVMSAFFVSNAFAVFVSVSPKSEDSSDYQRSLRMFNYTKGLDFLELRKSIVRNYDNYQNVRKLGCFYSKCYLWMTDTGEKVPDNLKKKKK